MSTRVYVLEATQTLTDKPMHSASRKMITLVVSAGKAAWKGKKLVQLTTKESWLNIKLYFRDVMTKPVEIPVIRQYNKDEHFGIQLQYPTPDRTSYAKQNFIAIWGSNQRRAHV